MRLAFEIYLSDQEQCLIEDAQVKSNPDRIIVLFIILSVNPELS